MTEPQVTIVVVPREQFSKAQASLESIYAATSTPFELVYVDGNSPPPLRRYLARQAAARGFTLLRTERHLTSNEARNLGLRHVRTKFVAFLDNDVFVLPGWLEALVRCAEETGAWVVGPLYCYGAEGSGAPDVVHTAGADLRIVDEGGRHLHEEHRHVNRPVAEVRPELRREPIDLVEFHCMLVRRSALERIGALDERLLSFFDHIDFCLAVHAAGGTVYIEPEGVVTHLAPPPFAWADVPYFLLRWSDAWLRSSLRHFASKHRLSVSDREFQNHVWFRNDHRRRLIAGVRRRIRQLLGKRSGKIVDEIMDRIVFDLVVEQTIVRRMEHRRTAGGPGYRQVHPVVSEPGGRVIPTGGPERARLPILRGES
jgi:GT2 family glycosyltransferase